MISTINMTQHIKIETTPAVRRFNSALERADELSGYRFDRVEPMDLVRWLLARGYRNAADELASAALAVGCWVKER